MKWENLIKDALAYAPAKRTSTIRAAICGVGGAGNNSVSRLSKMELSYTRLISLNSDRVALENNDAKIKILMGHSVTRGRSTGGSVEMGERIAELSRAEIAAQLLNHEMVYVLAGLGGGTGSGSGPVVANIAKSTGALVVSIVTLPFRAEGTLRQSIAKDALQKFYENSHTVIVIDNNKLLEIEPNLPLRQAFAVIDYLISNIIKSLNDTVNVPSLMNVDFSDLNIMMRRGGTSTILYGEGDMNDIDGVVYDTLNTKFLDVDITGATGAIVHVTGGKEMSLKILNRVIEGITSNIMDNAEVKIGARVDKAYTGKLKVTTILTGITDMYSRPRPTHGYGEALVDALVSV